MLNQLLFSFVGWFHVWVLIAFAAIICFCNVDAAWTDDPSKPGKWTTGSLVMLISGILLTGLTFYMAFH